MYSYMKLRAFSTPCWTLESGILYSFISPGMMVNAEHVWATMAIATVVHTR
eukprot:gene2209-gene1659